MKKTRPRQIRVFFYGLFMDAAALQAQGLHPTDVQQAELPGFSLRIGQRATLVLDPERVVHGVVMCLTHGELRQLYSAPSVESYQPEAVLVRIRDGHSASALCFNLPAPPPPSESNRAYAEKLRELAGRLGLPARYAGSIQSGPGGAA